MKPILYLLLFTALLSSCGSKEEIAQWRGANRDGIYPDTNLLKQWPEGGPQLLWKFDSLGQGYSSPATTSENIYIMGTIDSITYLYNFDLTGKLLYKTKIGRDWTVNWPGIRSSPLIYKDLGYVLNGLGVVYCFDPNNGEVVWQKDLVTEFGATTTNFGFCDNLLADGDQLFCTPAGPQTTVIALNRYNGELVWKSETLNDTNTYCSPIMIERGGKKFFINQTQKNLFAIDIENGLFAWKVDLENKWHPSTPYYRDGYLFVIDGWKGGSFQLKISDDGMSCQEVWRNKTFNVVQGHVVVLGNRIYGLNIKERACLNWDNGEKIYSDSVKLETETFISADNMIYAYADEKGDVELLEPGANGFISHGSFKIKGGSNQHCAHPVIHSGKFYLRHDNSLFVYDIRNKNQ